MSNQVSEQPGDGPSGAGPPSDERLRRRRRAGYGCLAVMVAVAVLVGGVYFALNAGVEAIKDQFNPAEDYTGNGTGAVLVEVEEGEAATDIANTLVAKGVVKSEEAFTDAAQENADSVNIQVGFYKMKKELPAEEALGVLLDPNSLIQDTVAFPEGWTVDQIVKELARKTDFSQQQYQKVLDSPSAIRLPASAGGNPEGYLFPATYLVSPNAKPQAILSMMVDRFREAAAKLDLTSGADDLGVSQHEVMTVASLIQAEARFDKDFPKVSRVIYNRRDENMPLQFDSTVHYAVGRDGTVGTSDNDRAVDSPYNTYKYSGLPPSPIMAPGEKAIEAALHPVDGPWLYFVTTNPDTGETKFAKSYKRHLKNKAEFDAWCRGSDDC